MKRYAWGVVALCACLGSVAAEIQLRFKGGLQGREEDSGELVMVLAKGDEYTAQVVCDDAQEAVVIKGLEGNSAFDVARTGSSQQMTTINGRTSASVTHTYRVQPRVTGSYVLGPATLRGNDAEQSNTVRVRVVDPAAYDQFAGKKGAARQALRCQMTIDAHELFVGQSGLLTVVMEDDGQVFERGLEQPSFGTLQAQPIGKPNAEQKMVNGAVRVVTTQSYHVTADTPGSYTIGGAVAHFVVPDETQDRDMGGIFGNFFGPSGKRRSIPANNLIITIKPLPLHTAPVDGVGMFESVALKATKQTIDLNEPCTLQFMVSGAGNFDSLVAPHLTVSDDVSLYPSTTSFTGDATKGTKTFEYLIQIGTPGYHEIPAQSFVYFNTRDGEYKTLKTEPLSLTVRKPKVTSAATPTTSGVDTKKPKEQQRVLPNDADVFLPMIPWYWLLLIAIGGVLVVLRDRCVQLLAAIAEMLGITSERKRQRARLVALIAQRDIGLVYHFFVAYLARIAGDGVYENDIDGAWIVRHGVFWGLSEEQVREFAVYLDRCSQAAFAPQTVKEADKTALLEKALLWHDCLMQKMGAKA